MSTPAPLPVPTLSVVIATYARPQLLARMLDELEHQTVQPSAFEVVVVDDGSPQPVETGLEGRVFPFAFTLVRQKNAGPAAARDRGALLARGRILMFLDDDMRLPPALLESHLAIHAKEPRAAVLGEHPPIPGSRGPRSSSASTRGCSPPITPSSRGRGEVRVAPRYAPAISRCAATITSPSAAST